MKFTTFNKVLIALSIGAIVLGFYQGWIVMSRPNFNTAKEKVQGQPTAETNKSN